MALEGSLLDMSLVDLLQVFGMGAKTGRLMLEQPEKYSGMLWISKGSIANAATIELQTLSTVSVGEAAVIEMLQWEDAYFRFIPPAPNETYPSTINRPNEWLILEGLRRRDEQAGGGSNYPQLSLDRRLRLLVHPEDVSRRLNLTHEEWQVLTHSANAETIGQVLSATDYPEVEVFSILGRLMAARLVDLEPD